MSTAKTLAKGTAWGLIGSFLLRFVGFFYCIILARLFSQEEIGIFFLVLSIINIVALFSNLGLGLGAVLRYVPFYVGEEKFNHVRGVLKISLTAGTIFSLICMVFVILFSGDLSNMFHEQKLVPIFHIMAFYLLIYNFYSIALGFLVGRKLIKLSSYLQGFQVFAKLILTILLLFIIGFVAKSIALGFLLSFAFAMIFGGYWAIREYKRLPKSDELVNNYTLLRDMVPFGLTMVFLSSLSLINAEFDRIMLGYFLPENNTLMIGVYTIAVSFSSLILIFTYAIAGVFYPIITEFLAKKNISDISDTSLIFIRWVALSTVPVLLIMLIFPKNILSVIYGEKYVGGYLVLMLYSLGLFIYSFSFPIQNILSGMKRLDVTLKIMGFGALVNIISNLILIPRYGINGAAFASAISYSLMAVLFFYKRRITRLKIPRDIYKPMVAGIVTVFPLIFVKPFVGEFLALVPIIVTPTDVVTEIIGKFLKVSILGILASIVGAVYLAFLILFRAFVKEDVEIISGAMRRFNMSEKLITWVEGILLR